LSLYPDKEGFRLGIDLQDAFGQLNFRRQREFMSDSTRKISSLNPRGSPKTGQLYVADQDIVIKEDPLLKFREVSLPRQAASDWSA
jgi:hypothetical protein